MLGWYFYGYGCFFVDRWLLYVVENVFDIGDGVIGVYDMSGEVFIWFGEFLMCGIGLYEILLDCDGKMFVVVNGGIWIYFDCGWEKFNLDNMWLLLVYLVMEIGDFVVEYWLDLDL